MEFAGNNDGGDPFASLVIPNCQPTSSQEEKSRVCPFARESERFPGNTQSSWETQPTGIVMVSLPESSEDYQTPPEQHSNTQNSVNDGPTRTADVHRKIESAGGGDGEVLVVEDSVERERLRTVDLTKDSDNLGSSEKSPGFLEEGNDLAMVNNNDTDRIGDEDGVDEIEAQNGVTEALGTELIDSQIDNSHKVFDEMPVREENEHMSSRKPNTTVQNIEDIHKFSLFRYVSNCNRKSNETASELIDSHQDSPYKVFDEMSGREQKEYMSSRKPNTTVKNVEDIDKFRYISNKGNCDLQSKTNGQGYLALMDVLDHALKLLAGEIKGGSYGDENDDTDLFETAKRRCVDFPRPRWWLSEGCEG